MTGGRTDTNIPTNVEYIITRLEIPESLFTRTLTALERGRRAWYQVRKDMDGLEVRVGS